MDLGELRCFEEERVVSRDLAISFKNRLFQILDVSRPCPRLNDKATVRIAEPQSMRSSGFQACPGGIFSNTGGYRSNQANRPAGTSSRQLFNFGFNSAFGRGYA